MEPTRDVPRFTLGKAISGAVAAAFGAALKVLLLHGVVFGVVLGVIAWWAASGANGTGWRWVTMVAVVYGVHALFVPVVMILGSVIALGHAVAKLGVGRALFAAAARRAEAMQPRLREQNDYGAIVRAMHDGLEAVTNDPASWSEAAVGRRATLARWGQRMARQVVRTGARSIMRELELVPHPDGRVEFATMDEWIGARADAMVGRSVRAEATKWFWVALLVQLAVTLAAVVGAMM